VEYKVDLGEKVKNTVLYGENKVDCENVEGKYKGKYKGNVKILMIMLML